MPAEEQPAKTFLDYNISPKLARNLKNNLGWTVPTDVQRTTLPIVLQNRDVLVQSVTGSGKTGAFAVPIVERIVLRGKEKYISTVVLAPTRELAEQTASVLHKMCLGLQISVCLLTGGANDFQQQQHVLNTEPDMIVATPGRLIDHLLNSPVNLSSVNVFVLDEADKLLELGFLNDIKQIMQHLPEARQTMLFSATMNSSVESLSALALRKPLRINVDRNLVTHNVEQQFVLVPDERAGDFDYRFALLQHLLEQFAERKVIVFVENKVLANRLAAYLEALSDLQYYKLTSQMSQAQRFSAVYEFNAVPQSVLVSTDLAARGLDISCVDVVVLFSVPEAYDQYVHRVGRTGRYDQPGLSVTLGTRAEVRRLVAQNEAQRAELRERALAPAQQARLARYREELRGAETRARIDAAAARMRAERQMERTDALLGRYESGELVERRRSWYLSPKDRKAIQQLLKDTRGRELTRHERARQLTDGYRRQNERKVRRGEQAARPRGDPAARAAVHAVKREIARQKKAGVDVPRDGKFDARRLR